MKDVEINLKLDEIEQKLPKEVIIDKSPKNADEVLSIAEINTDAAVTLSWSRIEDELKNVVNRTRISPDYPPYNSALRNINLLKENGYLDADWFSVIQDLYRMRNGVLHEKAQFSYDMAVKYFEIVQGVVQFLKRIENAS